MEIIEPLEIIGPLPDPIAPCDGWLGFDSRLGQLLAGDPHCQRGYVNPGETIQLRSSVQVLFKPRRMYVWHRTASDFIIHDLRIGCRSCFVAAGAIPADAFAVSMDKLVATDIMFTPDKVIQIKIGKRGSELMGADLNLSLMHPGMDITFVIENISNNSARFLAGIVGSVPHE